MYMSKEVCYIWMYVLFMYSFLATTENRTQDSSIVQPLTQSLYVLSYLRPTYSIHTLLSRGHNTSSDYFHEPKLVCCLQEQCTAGLLLRHEFISFAQLFSWGSPSHNHSQITPPGPEWKHFLTPANEVWLKFLENGNFNFFAKFSTDNCRRFWVAARH